MNIQIWISQDMPYATDTTEVSMMKNVIGSSKVEAFSIDKNNKIVKGIGYISMNDDYDYHKNIDKSKEAMFFNNKEQWFTLSEDRIKEIYNHNAKLIREEIMKKLDEYPEV